MSASAVILETASPGTARPEPTASELAELEAAILVLRRELERPQSGRLAAPDGSRLSLTAHFLNLAPSTTARLRLWMILGTEAGVELLGDPLAHLRPVDTLETGVAPGFSTGWPSVSRSRPGFAESAAQAGCLPPPWCVG